MSDRYPPTKPKGIKETYSMNTTTKKTEYFVVKDDEPDTLYVCEPILDVTRTWNNPVVYGSVPETIKLDATGDTAEYFSAVEGSTEDLSKLSKPHSRKRESLVEIPQDIVKKGAPNFHEKHVESSKSSEKKRLLTRDEYEKNVIEFFRKAPNPRVFSGQNMSAPAQTHSLPDKNTVRFQGDAVGINEDIFVRSVHSRFSGWNKIKQWDQSPKPEQRIKEMRVQSNYMVKAESCSSIDSIDSSVYDVDLADDTSSISDSPDTLIGRLNPLIKSESCAHDKKRDKKQPTRKRTRFFSWIPLCVVSTMSVITMIVVLV